jgi:hypothetical protein
MMGLLCVGQCVKKKKNYLIHFEIQAGTRQHAYKSRGVNTL